MILLWGRMVYAHQIYWVEPEPWRAQALRPYNDFLSNRNKIVIPNINFINACYRCFSGSPKNKSPSLYSPLNKGGEGGRYLAYQKEIGITCERNVADTQNIVSLEAEASQS